MQLPFPWRGYSHATHQSVISVQLNHIPNPTQQTTNNMRMRNTNTQRLRNSIFVSIGCSPPHLAQPAATCMICNQTHADMVPVIHTPREIRYYQMRHRRRRNAYPVRNTYYTVSTTQTSPSYMGRVARQPVLSMARRRCW